MLKKLLYLSGIAMLLGLMPVITGCADPALRQRPPDIEQPVEPPPGGTDINEPVEPPPGGTDVSGAVTIIESSGWLEALFVKWEKLASAERFNVYYRSGSSDWKKIDEPLIREYQDYYRADITGIGAGIYDVKVLPVNSDGVEEGEPGTSSGIQVLAHDRSGFAFSGGIIPGAYKADGTPKNEARILYVTDANKDTVALEIKTSNSKVETFTGLNAILETGMQKGYENRPLIVRFIGKIGEKKGSPFTDNEGSLMIKDNGKHVTSYITLEGIGDDATAYRWGIRTSRASNVEVRNLGFMLSNTTQKDALELQNSNYMWIHNCDFFYGMSGSASDQAKGDGALDVKECDKVSIAFNHFWDTGKSGLLGNSASETPGCITYHHNWFDHSDSRHPRARVHKAHVYNNYFDGIGKYGIGATLGSSIFAEGNYFRNSKKPMLISMQGSDIAGGTGTFSSEDGGIIKAFNNYMDPQSLASYRPWSGTNTIEFDAYEVQSADEAVPATVTAKKGGAVYDNDFLAYAYTADTPLTAKENTVNWSGRYWRGDFSWTFNNATDDAHVDEPMPALKTALLNYASKLVSIQGETGTGDPGDGGDEGGDGGGPANTYNFSLPPLNTLPTSPFTEEISLGGLTFGSGSNLLTQNASTGGLSFTHCLRTGGAASAAQRYIVIPLTGPATIKLFASSNNSSATSINITSTAGSTSVIGTMALPAWNNSALGTPEWTSTTAGNHTVALKAAASARIFLIQVEYE